MSSEPRDHEVTAESLTLTQAEAWLRDVMRDPSTTSRQADEAARDVDYAFRLHGVSKRFLTEYRARIAAAIHARLGSR